MKIPPRVREQAAILCSQNACWYTGEDDVYEPIAYADFDIREVAMAAVDSITFSISYLLPPPIFQHEMAAVWAEAEALLRTGWEP